MSEPVGPQRGDPLFRREAIEEYLRGREHGVPLRVSPLWKHWAFGALVITFAGAVAFAALAPIGVDVRGEAVVRRAAGGGQSLEVVLLLPVESRPSLRAGQRVVVDMGERSRVRLALALGEPLAENLGPERARAWLGGAAGDVPALPSPVVLAVAAVGDSLSAAEPRLAPGWTGVAYVRVGERTLLSALALQAAR